MSKRLKSESTYQLNMKAYLSTILHGMLGTIEDKMGKKYVLRVKDVLEKEQEFKETRVYEPDAIVLSALRM